MILCKDETLFVRGCYGFKVGIFVLICVLFEIIKGPFCFFGLLGYVML